MQSQLDKLRSLTERLTASSPNSEPDAKVLKKACSDLQRYAKHSSVVPITDDKDRRQL